MIEAVPGPATAKDVAAMELCVLSVVGFNIGITSVSHVAGFVLDCFFRNSVKAEHALDSSVFHCVSELIKLALRTPQCQQFDSLEIGVAVAICLFDISNAHKCDAFVCWVRDFVPFSPVQLV